MITIISQTYVLAQVLSGILLIDKSLTLSLLANVVLMQLNTINLNSNAISLYASVPPPYLPDLETMPNRRHA
jgi:hypothetical protein